MRKNLRVLDLKPTTCRLLLILCGLVVLLVGVPYSAEAGKPSKQEPIRMDVILGPGGLDLDPCVLVDPPEDCVIQGDSSVISGDDERSFIDPAELDQPCYGSALIDGIAGAAYFGNCLNDFWLPGEDGILGSEEDRGDDILIIRGHLLTYADKKTKSVVGVQPKFADANGNRYSGGVLNASSVTLAGGDVLVTIDAPLVEMRLSSGAGKNKRKSFLAGTINIGDITYTPKP